MRRDDQQCPFRKQGDYHKRHSEGQAARETFREHGIERLACDRMDVDQQITEQQARGDER